MITDSLVGLVDMLPNLDVGKCIVVEDISVTCPTKSYFRVKLKQWIEEIDV